MLFTKTSNIFNVEMFNTHKMLSPISLFPTRGKPDNEIRANLHIACSMQKTLSLIFFKIRRKAKILIWSSEMVGLVFVQLALMVKWNRYFRWADPISAERIGASSNSFSVFWHFFEFNYFGRRLNLYCQNDVYLPHIALVKSTCTAETFCTYIALLIAKPGDDNGKNMHHLKGIFTQCDKDCDCDYCK